MDALRVANCSGFYGDRLSAAREMVEGGPIDVLTGDYLAELTMAILWRIRMKDPAAGYTPTFLTQMEQVLGTCLDRGIKVVANAGGLNPSGLADRLREIAARLGLAPSIAVVAGDDLMHRLEELAEQGEPIRHLETGEDFLAAGMPALTANAYLGGWGIAAALERGADVVVTGRVSDASLVVGPAAWRFGWDRDDWDALAGAVVAGHIIECGAQCTGGNYSFFDEVPGLEHPGFPIAEVRGDGSSVITKHPGTGGLVSVGTVTAQLLYEIGPPRYLNPDVTARFDTIRLTQEGTDRVLVAGVRGEPPPPTTKVGINCMGGYRNSMTIVVPGLDVAAKAALAERTLWEAVGGRDRFAETHVQLVRSDKPDPASNEEACAHLRITVMDPDPARVGRAFSGMVVEQALAGFPGFTLPGPPTGETPFAVFWPGMVRNEVVPQQVTIDGEHFEVAATGGAPPGPDPEPPGLPPPPGGETVRVPLGRVLGARAGDKGGDANLGIWARSDAGFAWLAAEIDEARLGELLPEAAAVPLGRHLLPNLRAVNFVLRGFLGRGAAASAKPDPQAKTLGEYLRARVADVPAALVQEGAKAGEIAPGS